MNTILLSNPKAYLLHTIRALQGNDLIINVFNVDEVMKDTIKEYGEYELVEFDYANKDSFLEFYKNWQGGAIEYIASRATTALDAHVLKIAKDKGLIGVFHPTASLPGIDIDAAKNLNIAVYNTHTNGRETATTIFGQLTFMLSGQQDAPPISQESWQQAYYVNHKKSIADYTIGVVGFGHVGKPLVELIDTTRASTFILASSNFDEERAKEEFDNLDLKNANRAPTLEDLAKKCDIIINVVPYKIHETHYLFSTSFFNDFYKEGGMNYFMQYGGSKTLDEKALLEAIKNGKVKAHVDTFENEGLNHASVLYDVYQNPDYPNALTITHHIAGVGDILKVGEYARNTLLLSFASFINKDPECKVEDEFCFDNEIHQNHGYEHSFGF